MRIEAVVVVIVQLHVQSVPIGQTKDYKIGICCFSTRHAALRRKSKDWLARNQDNVPMWDDMLSTDFCFSQLDKA
jgi:hypothetical protein